MNPNFLSNRRGFLTGAALTAGMYGLNFAAQAAETTAEKDSGLFVIGPKPGYTPQVGTLVFHAHLHSNRCHRLSQGPYHG